MARLDDVAADEDRAEVVRRERLLLDPAVRADRQRVRALLHPDFVEFGASGRVWDVDSIGDALATDSARVAHSAVALASSSLSTDAVLLTYRIEEKERTTLRSSVWLRNAGGEWLLRFHQGTRAPGHQGTRAPGP